ncbi:MAG: MFS transporter [Caulobacteraceae bacterium]|nr:MFS transporter [Caulobacteraceae bacterium]
MSWAALRGDQEAAAPALDRGSAHDPAPTSEPARAPEPAPVEAVEKPFSSLAPAIIGASMLMQTLSATVLSNALPTMARSLHEDPVHLNTAITIYLLAGAIFLPVSGWAADKYGARRVFLIAIGLYGASCAASALAQNLAELLTARFCQGAAGAMMGPVGRLVLLRSTPKHDLVRAMSVLTMPALLGPVIGPAIGGLIVTYGSWRWIFLFNLPIAAVGILLVLRFIDDVREEAAAPLDWVGLVLTAVGMAAVVYGFENLGRDDLPALGVAGLLGGGAGLLAIYAWYADRNPYAILDLKLLRIRTFFASVVGGAFLRMGVGALPFLLALLLQVAFGFSPFHAGLMTLASAAAALVMKTAAPPILAHFGFRRTLTVNAALVGALFMACALFTRQTPVWFITLLLLTGGFFRSLQFTSLNGLAFADVETQQMSRASTMSTMGQQLAQSIGVGLAATMLHLFQVRQHAEAVSVAVISPVFLIIGVVTLISGLFFVALPADAGAALHGRPRRVRG